MRIVIIGNGIAGNTAALTIKKGNPEVNLTLISQENYPLYSPCALPHYLSGKVERKQLFLKGVEDYFREEIKIILGEKVEKIDVKNKEVILSSRIIPFDKLVIATGSEVIMPPIEGLNKEGVFPFKSLTDADRLSHWSGRKAVVIGSGFIGIEVAIALKMRNYQVHIIELLDWILPRAFDEYPASLLAKILQENDIKISVRERVSRIIGGVRVNGVVTDKQEIKCDTVILATGMKPNVELSRRAGLEIGKLGGIVVNKEMLSSVPNIYACGDCIETEDLVSGEKALNLLWHNAKEQAKFAANNCLNKQEEYPGSINITGIDIFGVQAVSLGITSATAGQSSNKLEIIERSWGLDYLRLIIRGGVLVGVQAVSRIKDFGFLLSAILRKEDLRLPEKGGSNLSYLWWRWRINRYLSKHV